MKFEAIRTESVVSITIEKGVKMRCKFYPEPFTVVYFRFLTIPISKETFKSGWYEKIGKCYYAAEYADLEHYYIKDDELWQKDTVRVTLRNGKEISYSIDDEDDIKTVKELAEKCGLEIIKGR